jgi:hypothetical protein
MVLEGRSRSAAVTPRWGSRWLRTSSPRSALPRWAAPSELKSAACPAPAQDFRSTTIMALVAVSVGGQFDMRGVRNGVREHLIVSRPQ